MRVQREHTCVKYKLDKHDDGSCYCKDTIRHFRENERKYYVNNNCLTYYEFNCDDRMRTCPFYLVRQRLIEWMILIQDYYSSSEETLEMAIRLFNYLYFIDLYSNTEDGTTSGDKLLYRLKEKMQNRPKIHSRCICGSTHNGWLTLEDLQLVALACYFLSCKFWERFPPKLSKLIHLTEYGYSEKQLLQKEKEILMLLDFDLKVPLITQYLEFFMLHEKHFLLNKIIPVSHYLYNLTLTEPRFLNRLASSLAAAIMTMSKMLLCSFSGWDPKQIQYVYDEQLFEMSDFREIFNDLWTIFCKSLVNKESFKKKKFSDKKYSHLFLYISNLDLDFIGRHFIELVKNLNMKTNEA